MADEDEFLKFYEGQASHMQLVADAAAANLGRYRPENVRRTSLAERAERPLWPDSFLLEVPIAIVRPFKAQFVFIAAAGVGSSVPVIDAKVRIESHGEIRQTASARMFAFEDWEDVVRRWMSGELTDEAAAKFFDRWRVDVPLLTPGHRLAFMFEGFKPAAVIVTVLGRELFR